MHEERNVLLPRTAEMLRAFAGMGTASASQLNEGSRRRRKKRKEEKGENEEEKEEEKEGEEEKEEKEEDETPSREWRYKLINWVTTTWS